MHRSIPLALAVGAALTVSACGSSSSSSSSSTTAAAPGGTPTTSTGGGGAASVRTGNPTSAVTLNESGSSLLFPFLQELVSPLSAQYSNVHLAPAAGGSGKGISDAIAGTSQLGGSDAYLAPAQVATNPGLLNIPIAVSSQSVDYNLPGVTGLKLSGKVLAGIYEGKIAKWNDPAITALNPGATLPSTAIVPVRRVDSSGDTFLFTGFLSKTDPTWANGPAQGTSVTWPAATGELTASGNPGMVQTCKSTPGCVAYIGISAQSAATAAGLGQAMLQNAAGQFVLPTNDAVLAAVNSSTGNVPESLAANLLDAPGAASYPIVNFEYVVVKSSQPDANTALAIRDFLSFAIDPNGGSQPSLLAKEDFQALPSSVVPKVTAAIAKIS